MDRKSMTWADYKSMLLALPDEEFAILLNIIGEVLMERYPEKTAANVIQGLGEKYENVKLKNIKAEIHNGRS